MIVGGVPVIVQVEIVSQRVWQAGDQVGIVLLDPSSGAQVAECAVRCSPDCNLVSHGPNVGPVMTPIQASPIFHLTMGWSSYAALGEYDGDCYTDTGLGAGPLAISAPLPSAYPALLASPTIAIANIDILQ